MIGLDSSRQKPAALRRSVLGLVATLWLNMAVLPCAMAFESDDFCQHCPPAVEHEMASHHGHAEVQAKPSCLTMQSQCCDLEEASIDVRGCKLEVKPTTEAVLITAPAVAKLPSRSPGHVSSALDPPHISGCSPPLHVLFCVYLD
ncbi:MAG: hypothetical protein ACR2QI_02055 [Woeseiaceae bacterium]